jgi:hypothetical protein
MADGQGQDPTAPVTLMVQITDPTTGQVTQLSLADYLEQADDAMAQADTISGDAIVTLTDGETMTGAQYQQLVAQYQQQAHANAGKQLDAFTASLNLSVETFSGLAGHMHDHADSVTRILGDLRADMRGIHAAIGNDDNGNKFRTNFDAYYPGLQSNIGTLRGSLSNIGDGLNTSADNTFACEKNTLAGFGRQAVDPRTRPGGH